MIFSKFGRRAHPPSNSTPTKQQQHQQPHPQQHQPQSSVTVANPHHHLQPRAKSSHPFQQTVRRPMTFFLALSLGLVLTCTFCGFSLALSTYLLSHSPAARPHPSTVSTTTLLSALNRLNKRFSVRSEKVVYNRYARVYDRQIRFPNGQTFSFDVWGRVWRNDSFSVVAVVPFDRLTQTFTLVREYNPAHARYVYSFPQGMVERSKHTSIQKAAAAELEEEAHLRCRSWTPLLSQGSPGVPQDKYQREVVHLYLCSDAVPVSKPAHLDDEEDIEIIQGVTAQQIYSLSEAGVLQSNNIAAGLMAIDRLRQSGALPLRM